LSSFADSQSYLRVWIQFFENKFDPDYEAQMPHFAKGDVKLSSVYV